MIRKAFSINLKFELYHLSLRNFKHQSENNKPTPKPKPNPKPEPEGEKKENIEEKKPAVNIQEETEYIVDNLIILLFKK